MYRQKLTDQFQEERLYLKNKLAEERINFEMLMEKVEKTISSALERLEQSIFKHWEVYNKDAQRHLESETEYNQLIEHFKKGDWTIHPHVDQSVNFLYS